MAKYLDTHTGGFHTGVPRYYFLVARVLNSETITAEDCSYLSKLLLLYCIMPGGLPLNEDIIVAEITAAIAFIKFYSDEQIASAVSLLRLLYKHGNTQDLQNIVRIKDIFPQSVLIEILRNHTDFLNSELMMQLVKNTNQSEWKSDSIIHESLIYHGLMRHPELVRYLDWPVPMRDTPLPDASPQSNIVFYAIANNPTHFPIKRAFYLSFMGIKDNFENCESLAELVVELNAKGHREALEYFFHSAALNNLINLLHKNNVMQQKKGITKELIDIRHAQWKFHQDAVKGMPYFLDAIRDFKKIAEYENSSYSLRLSNDFIRDIYQVLRQPLPRSIKRQELENELHSLQKLKLAITGREPIKLSREHKSSEPGFFNKKSSSSEMKAELLTHIGISLIQVKHTLDKKGDHESLTFVFAEFADAKRFYENAFRYGVIWKSAPDDRNQIIYVTGKIAAVLDQLGIGKNSSPQQSSEPVQAYAKRQLTKNYEHTHGVGFEKSSKRTKLAASLLLLAKAHKQIDKFSDNVRNAANHILEKYRAITSPKEETGKEVNKSNYSVER